MTNEEVKSSLKSKGLEWIGGEFKKMNSKLICKTKEGYFCVVTYWNQIKQNKQTSLFSKSNPYTIENIKQYIEINDVTTCKYWAGEFTTVKDKNLEFECSCGNHFFATWENFTRRNQHKCRECSNYKEQKSFEEIVNELKEFGYEVFSSKENFINVSDSIIDAKDKEGYKYHTRYRTYMRGSMLHGRYNKSNIYTIDNINLYFTTILNNEYTCLSDTYVDQETELIILHKTCGRTFLSSWEHMYRKPTEVNPNCLPNVCPYCQKKKTESVHALVLKQIWKHEKPNTVLEEKSCRSTITGYILPTDIVNHDDKIAIEVQSNYHDTEKQQLKDKIKKQFWINNGYKFYAVDIRDYSPLKMVQIFFPYIKEIPTYVDFNFSDTLDIIEAQDLLNQYISIKEISNIMNTDVHRIHDALSCNRLTYPNGYIMGDETAIVQLTQDGEFIRHYEKIAKIKEYGFKPNNIANCLHSKRYASSGYLWFYLNDYRKGNWEIPKTLKRKRILNK